MSISELETELREIFGNTSAEIIIRGHRKIILYFGEDHFDMDVDSERGRLYGVWIRDRTGAALAKNRFTIDQQDTVWLVADRYQKMMLATRLRA